MVADTQAMDLLQELNNRNITPIDNQTVADGGLTDNVTALLGARPGAETIILEQLAPALPEAINTHENALNVNIDPILGMDL
ncbi:MAG: hypothetical protein COB36_06635 [Alphaproteobacteria bacterium]|nr:MAG: hypothetical protein COB36_06635 [Alphaproteobacteria bacterium]